MNQLNHPYHLVNVRPWPLATGIGAFVITSGLVKWFHSFDRILFFTGLVTIIFVSYQWWRDVSREATFQGIHSDKVGFGLRWGIILFIISEVFFFVSFFWAFFHRSLSPNIEVGALWPPIGVERFNPFQVPLLNTRTVSYTHLTLPTTPYV